jgi:hypothetical protein
MRNYAAIGLLALLGLAAGGCASSPLSDGHHTPAAAATTPPATAAASLGPSSSASTTVDPRAMQQVLAEVQKAGALDPESQNKLVQDLQQTDPSLWPLVVQQFRATMAYRQEVQQRQSLAGTQQPPLSGQQLAVANPQAAAGTHGILTDNSRGGTAAVTGSQQPAVGAQPPTTVAASSVANPVNSTSYTTPAADDWRSHLTAAIRLREAELHNPAKNEDDEARQAQLRLMYLLAGRRDDALLPMPGAAPATQGFWSAELYGLSAYLDTEHTPDASHRAAEAKQRLGEALTKIGESCPLVVRNLTFCKAVQSYGCTQAFEKYEFAPAQEVIIYAEVENLANESTPHGYHTALQSSYQIFDARGQRVGEAEFPLSEETCRNPRRDYYVDYRLRLPERIYSGSHTLQLTIVDQVAHKTGQSTMEFKIETNK